MERLTDVSAADWLREPSADLDQLVRFGPNVFVSYARARYIPDPVRPQMREAEVTLPEDHASDLEIARRVLHVLARFTSTPHDCFFCVWDGWGSPSHDPTGLDGPLVELPHRRYALYRGPVVIIDRWEQLFGNGSDCPPPAFVWPSDHRWCFASDVDPHWAGVGAGADVIAALTTTSGIDAVPVKYDDRSASYWT